MARKVSRTRRGEKKAKAPKAARRQKGEYKASTESPPFAETFAVLIDSQTNPPQITPAIHSSRESPDVLVWPFQHKNNGASRRAVFELPPPSVYEPPGATDWEQRPVVLRFESSGPKSGPVVKLSGELRSLLACREGPGAESYVQAMLAWHEAACFSARRLCREIEGEPEEEDWKRSLNAVASFLIALGRKTEATHEAAAAAAILGWYTEHPTRDRGPHPSGLRLITMNPEQFIQKGLAILKQRRWDPNYLRADWKSFPKPPSKESTTSAPTRKPTASANLSVKKSDEDPDFYTRWKSLGADLRQRTRWTKDMDEKACRDHVKEHFGAVHIDLMNEKIASPAGWKLIEEFKKTHQYAPTPMEKARGLKLPKSDAILELLLSKMRGPGRPGRPRSEPDKPRTAKTPDRGA